MKKLVISLTLNIILLLTLVSLVYVSRRQLHSNLVKYRTNNIVMLGNSLTNGAGFWELLLHRNDVVNSGTSGFTTRHFIWVLKRDVYAYNPKICFVEGGINDIGMKIPVDTIFSNYKQIIDSLQKHNIIPVMQSTVYKAKSASNSYEDNLQVSRLNCLLQDYCHAKGIAYIDLNLGLSEGGFLKEEYTYDGIHLKSEAYLLWRKDVLAILDRLYI